MKKAVGIIFLIFAILITVLFIGISSTRNLTAFENVLFQIISLLSSFIGSYILGKESAQNAAHQMVRPHARSAFRRLLSQYGSLQRLAMDIKLIRENENSHPETMHALDKLEGIIIEQIYTADDALGDWEDIVPEDVAELRSKMALKDSQR